MSHMGDEAKYRVREYRPRHRARMKIQHQRVGVRSSKHICGASGRRDQVSTDPKGRLGQVGQVSGTLHVR